MCFTLAKRRILCMGALFLSCIADTGDLRIGFQTGVPSEREVHYVIALVRGKDNEAGGWVGQQPFSFFVIFSSFMVLESREMTDSCVACGPSRAESESATRGCFVV